MSSDRRNQRRGQRSVGLGRFAAFAAQRPRPADVRNAAEVFRTPREAVSRPATPRSAFPRSLAAAGRRGRGFTLLELVVVVAVFLVLAGMTLVALGGMRSRAAFGSAAALFPADVRALRHKAIAEQRRRVLLFLAKEGGELRYIALADDTATSAEDLDPTASSVTSRVEVDRTFNGNVALGPAGGRGKPFLAPFSSVPHATPCSFCLDGFALPWRTRGLLIFRTDGSIGFSGGGPAGVLSLFDTDAPVRRASVAISGATGIVRVFEP